MSLLTYEQARPWAKAIKEEVLERRMPPWGAVKGFGEFRDDPSLSQEEVLLLADWVEGGAPEGDPAYAPYEPDVEKAKPSPMPRGVTLKGSHMLSADVLLRAIRPESLSEGASVRVIARRPDGSSEPLLWLREYKPKWRRSYTLRRPLALAKGTRIEVFPADAGTLALVISAPPAPTAAPSPGR